MLAKLIAAGAVGALIGAVAVAAMGNVVCGVADGDLTPRDAAQLATVIQIFARTLSTADLERELKDLVKAPE